MRLKIFYNLFISANCRIRIMYKSLFTAIQNPKKKTNTIYNLLVIGLNRRVYLDIIDLSIRVNESKAYKQFIYNIVSFYFPSHLATLLLLYVYTHLMCIIISVSPIVQQLNSIQKTICFIWVKRGSVAQYELHCCNSKGVNMLVCMVSRWMSKSMIRLNAQCESQLMFWLFSLLVTEIHPYACYRANNKFTTVSLPPSRSGYQATLLFYSFEKCSKEM